MVTGSYILDTDTCSYIIKRSNQAVLKRLREVRPDETAVSVITKSELLFGLAVAPRRQQIEPLTQAFLSTVVVLDLTEAICTHYAEIRAFLKTLGKPIGANDLFLAAHARSLGLTLVTNNVREFGRVPGLRIENWAAE